MGWDRKDNVAPSDNQLRGDGNAQVAVKDCIRNIGTGLVDKLHAYIEKPGIAAGMVDYLSSVLYI